MTNPGDPSCDMAIIRENLALRRVLRQLADQFQQVYESAYAAAPAGENGVYAEARQLLHNDGSTDG
jgi:hypothetical protein